MYDFFGLLCLRSFLWQVAGKYISDSTAGNGFAYSSRKREEMKCFSAASLRPVKSPHLFLCFRIFSRQLKSV